VALSLLAIGASRGGSGPSFPGYLREISRGRRLSCGDLHCLVRDRRGGLPASVGSTSSGQTLCARSLQVPRSDPTRLAVWLLRLATWLAGF